MQMDESVKMKIALGVVAFMFFFGGFSMPSWTAKLVCMSIGITAGIILYFQLKGGNNNNGTTTNQKYFT